MGSSPTTVPSIFLAPGVQLGSMMLVIFRILLVDIEIVLRDIHKLCSEEHVPDPN